MTEFCKNGMCKQAEQYYYDFLCNENAGQIPEKIIEHINQCKYCREKINRLDKGLSASNNGKSENRRFACAITDLLSLHMAYIGNKVACKTVRPFLPIILDRNLGIRIPTPITVHLDHCQQCARDLETITSLNLSQAQSCRLSQLIADKTTKDTVSCQQARAAIPAVVSMAFNKTTKQILEHLCKCENCRQALYGHRETVRTECENQKQGQKCSSCKKLSGTEIFDYAVPYGLDPADIKSSSIYRDSITAHLRDCPTGLEKIQWLHRTISEIIERDESDIATIYHIDDFVKQRETNAINPLYTDYPITVKVTTREDIDNEQLSTTIRSFGSERKKVPIPSMRCLLKTSIIAVAVLMMAIGFFFKTSAAGALSINELYAALEKANNVHTSKFIPEKEEPISEEWFSRSRNILIMKTEDNLMLWNFTTGQRTIKNPDIDSVQITQVPDDLNAHNEKKQKRSLGLIEFYSISDLPEGAKWNRAADNEQLVSTKDTQVYDLSWQKKSSHGSIIISNIARFTVDSYTNLPVNIQFYSKSEGETEYTLNSIKTVEYIDDNEMQNVIEKYF